MTYLPPQKSLTIGGRTFDQTELSNLIVLSATHCSTATRYNTLRKNGTAAGYAVTALKTMRVHVAVLGVSSTTAAFGGVFFYADNDSGADSVTTPTNAVYLNGDSTATIGLANGVANGGGGSQVAVNLIFDVPAGKYLGFQPTAASMSVIAYCTES